MKPLLSRSAVFWPSPAFSASGLRGSAKEPPLWRQPGPWRQIRSRPDVAETAAESLGDGKRHRRVCRRAGSRLDYSPAGFARSNGIVRRGQSAQGAQAAERRSGIRLLRAGASCSGVRPGRQSAGELGRLRRRRLCVARFESWHFCRLQRQCVDRRQWARRTAWSRGASSCGTGGHC